MENMKTAAVKSADVSTGKHRTKDSAVTSYKTKLLDQYVDNVVTGGFGAWGAWVCKF
jgi:hypothetical protein